MNKIIKVVPNIITISRLISVIVGFILFLNKNIEASVYLFIYGAISDFFDGYIARKYNVYSKLGSYLDAICDKLYVLVVVILSIISGRYFMISIIVIEIIISIINIKMDKDKKKPHTERVGKYKMTLECILLILSLIVSKIKYVWYIYILFLVLTIYFSVQSIFAYINQSNNKVIDCLITSDDFKDKSLIDKIKLNVKEFKYYLLNPVKIIK